MEELLEGGFCRSFSIFTDRRWDKGAVGDGLIYINWNVKMLHTSFTENTFSLLYHCKWQVELQHHPLVCQWWIPVDTYLTFQIWTCWLRIICCFQQEAMDINKRSSSGEWIHLCNPYQICPLHCADYNVMYKCFTPWQGQGLQMLLASECGKLHALSARSIFRYVVVVATILLKSIV